jgi:hypothetical protein
MTRYHIDVKLWGTAYIEAETREEAGRLFDEHFGTSEKPQTVFFNRSDKDVPVDVPPCDQDDHKVFLSPVATAYGADKDDDLAEVD